MSAPLTPMATLRWNYVRPILAGLKPATVLEIGCGQGAAGVRLAGRADYLGVEPDERSYLVASRRITPLGGTVVHGDHTAVPAGSRYDLVCAFEVLEHLADDADTLSQWAALVRPGGHLVVSVPAWQQRFGPMDELVGHYRRYSPDDLDGILRKAGLRPVRVRLYGWPLGYLLEAVRNRAAGRVGRDAPDSRAERTAGSGRLLQPGRLAGAAVRMAAGPFGYVQRLTPRRGTGLVALAERPADAG